MTYTGQTRRIHLALALLWAIIFSPELFAGDPVPGAKHPVAQLVEWELTANSELKPDSIRRMVTVILAKAELADIPEKFKTITETFRASDEEARRAIIQAIPKDDLKELALIPVPIEYFEVPEAKLNALPTLVPHEISVAGVEQAKNYVKFQKDGESYIRWYLHPLADPADSSFAKIFKSHFDEDLKPQSGFAKFHFTSSRSIILFKGSYDDAISVKLSLKTAEGPFKNKAIHLKEYRAWIKHNAYLADLLPNHTPSMVMQREPYGLGVSSTAGEDAFLFRYLGATPEGGYYLPAFAMLDEKVGAAIAKLNGSTDPLAFWEEHFLKPFAAGMAEERAFTGAEHTSPHSQNIIVKLDKNMRPTDVIALRDADFYIDDIVYKKLNRTVLDSNGLVRDGIQKHQFTLRNGLHTLPSWMSEKDYQGWIKKYFSVFVDRYAEVTKIPLSAINTQIHKYEFYVWVVIEGDQFLEGGTNNFHGIPVAGRDFAVYHDLWLEKRKALLTNKPITMALVPPANAEPIKSTSPAPSVTPPANATARQSTEPIKNWDEFVKELSQARNLDSFGGRISVLSAEAAGMDLARRRALNELINTRYMQAKMVSSSNFAALLEVAAAFNELDPSYLKEIFSTLAGQMINHGASSDQIEAARKLLGKTEARTAVINVIRDGDYRELPAAIKRAEELFDKPYQWIADAFAYRFKRSSSPEQKLMLAEGLARIGNGDATVKKFFTNYVDSLPANTADSLRLLLKGRPAVSPNHGDYIPFANIDCISGFAQLY